MPNELTPPRMNMIVIGVLITIAFVAALVLTFSAFENAETPIVPITAFIVLVLSVFVMGWKYSTLSDSTAYALELCNARTLLANERERRTNCANKLEFTMHETLARMLEQGSDPAAIDNERTVQQSEVDAAWADVLEIVTLAKSLPIDLDSGEDDSTKPLLNEAPLAA